MDSFRKSLIEEMMQTLKIPQGSFNFITIAEEVELIPNDRLKQFYKEVMVCESFGNGMKAILKTAEKYKPKQECLDSKITQKAKRLIRLVHSMNESVFEAAKKSGRTFHEELAGTKFTNISNEEKQILNNVRCFDGKINGRYLVETIGHYNNSMLELIAFKNAIKYAENGSNLIVSNSMQKIQIKR